MIADTKQNARVPTSIVQCLLSSAVEVSVGACYCFPTGRRSGPLRPCPVGPDPHSAAAGVARRPTYPADLADRLQVTRQNLSNHLSCLRGCGLVVAVPQGRRSLYELADSRLAHAISDLVDLTWPSTRTRSAWSTPKVNADEQPTPH